MKTTKILMSLCLAIFLAGANMNAQVTIGSQNAPHAAAGLDIQTTTKGLKLPNVALNTDLTQFVLDGQADKATAKGMLVYNTTDNMVYMWNGTRWTPTSVDASLPAITVQPKAFSFSQNTTANGGSVTALSVTAVNATSYQWYEKPVNKNASTATAISGATAAIYAPPLTALGLKTYYCVVSNAKGSVNSESAEVAVGCGAKTVGGGWLKFQCHNLGADTSLDPFTWSGSVPGTSPSATDTQDGIKGSLFQWGRNNDGHQLRTATVYDSIVPVTLGENAQPVAGFGRGQFIKAPASPHDWRSPQYDLMWRPFQNGANDPCSSITGGTWRVPTQDEWSAIFSGTSGTTVPSLASANTWTWVSGTGGGYAIKPDGVTTTLFLPAVGYRNYSNGQFIGVSTNSSYWSSTPYGTTMSQYLTIDSGRVSPGHVGYRAYGFSVRCVAQN